MQSLQGPERVWRSFRPKLMWSWELRSAGRIDSVRPLHLWPSWLVATGVTLTPDRSESSDPAQRCHKCCNHINNNHVIIECHILPFFWQSSHFLPVVHSRKCPPPARLLVSRYTFSFRRAVAITQSGLFVLLGVLSCPRHGQENVNPLGQISYAGWTWRLVPSKPDEFCPDHNSDLLTFRIRTNSLKKFCLTSIWSIKTSAPGIACSTLHCSLNRCRKVEPWSCLFCLPAPSLMIVNPMRRLARRPHDRRVHRSI